MVKLIQNGWAKWSFIKTQKIMHLFTILCFNYLTLFKKKKFLCRMLLSLSLSSVPKALNLHKYTPLCFAISLSLSLSPWDPKALLLLQFPLPTRNQSATSFLYFSAPKTKPLPVFSEKTKPFLFIIIYIYFYIYIYISSTRLRISPSLILQSLLL